jgi:hypothetical protein
MVGRDARWWRWSAALLSTILLDGPVAREPRLDRSDIAVGIDEGTEGPIVRAIDRRDASELWARTIRWDPGGCGAPPLAVEPIGRDEVAVAGRLLDVRTGAFRKPLWLSWAAAGDQVAWADPTRGTLLLRTGNEAPRAILSDPLLERVVGAEHAGVTLIALERRAAWDPAAPRREPPEQVAIAALGARDQTVLIALAPGARARWSIAGAGSLAAMHVRGVELLVTLSYVRRARFEHRTYAIEIATGRLVEIATEPPAEASHPATP